jgi:hypothetical protein
MSNTDLSWMNVPGADGLTFAQKYERGLLPPKTSADLSWMNVRGADGLTFLEKFNQGKLPGQSNAAPINTGTPEQNNAYNEVKRYLTDFKLDSLIEPLWKYVIDTGVNNDDQLWLWIQDRPEFHTRFPAFKKLQEQGRAISPASYIEAEKAYERVMRAANIPATFFDKADDFTDLIVADVSPAEFQSRVEQGYKRVAQSGDLIRNAFKSYFGVEGDAALAAFFIDPERSAPALERAVKSAEIQAAALATESSVNLSYASKLADMGVSYEQAMQGFQRLNTMRSLFAGGIGETSIQSSSPESSSLTADLVSNRPPGLTPAVVGPDGSIPGGIGVSDDASAMDQQTQQGVDFLFGTDVGVQRELQMRLAKRKAQASGTSQQVVANREGRTAIGSAD